MIISELLKSNLQGRSFHFIDPMEEERSSKANIRYTTNGAYNASTELVVNRWDNEIPLNWIKSYLSPEIAKGLPNIAFAHLNTGDFNAEYLSLDELFKKLVKGGLIIVDIYGWETQENQSNMDKLLEKIGANSFQLVTKQLIIFK